MKLLEKFKESWAEIYKAVEDVLDDMFMPEWQGGMSREVRKIRSNPEDWKIYIDAVDELMKDNEDFEKKVTMTLSTGEMTITSSQGPRILN